MLRIFSTWPVMRLAQGAAAPEAMPADDNVGAAGAIVKSPQGKVITGRQGREGRISPTEALEILIRTTRLLMLRWNSC